MPQYNVRVDATHLSKVITEVRELAESVRTYGSRSDSTIAFRTPAALHVIAAQLESEMRSWAQAEGTLARALIEQHGGQAVRFPGLRAVLTYVTPAPVSREVQRAELCAAATRLRGVAAELGATLATLSAPKFVALLEEQATTILDFAAALG